jgi:hypothetical protein
VRRSPYSYGSPAPKRIRSGLLLIIVIGVVVLLSILVTFLGNGSSTTQIEPTLPPEVNVVGPTEVPTPGATVAPTSEPTVVASTATTADITYQAIQSAFHTLSTADWTVYARSLVNRHIVWQGQLQAVRSSDELWFTLDPASEGSIPQTALHLTQPIQALIPGMKATFEGDIARIVVFGQQVLVHIRNGHIISTQSD